MNAKNVLPIITADQSVSILRATRDCTVFCRVSAPSLTSTYTYRITIFHGKIDKIFTNVALDFLMLMCNLVLLGHRCQQIEIQI